jgi:PadR family transcriptional regulator, regulatory protein PadR
VKAEWESESHGRRGARRRIYGLTTKGRRKLATGRAEWQQFVRILGGILGAPA